MLKKYEPGNVKVKNKLSTLNLSRGFYLYLTLTVYLIAFNCERPLGRMPQTVIFQLT